MLLSVRSQKLFEEKIVVTVIELEFVCQTSAGIFLASISLSLRKNKNVIHRPRSVRIGKNCALEHSVSQYEPPHRDIDP